MIPRSASSCHPLGVSGRAERDPRSPTCPSTVSWRTSDGSRHVFKSACRIPRVVDLNGGSGSADRGALFAPNVIRRLHHTLHREAPNRQSASESAVGGARPSARVSLTPGVEPVDSMLATACSIGSTDRRTPTPAVDAAVHAATLLTRDGPPRRASRRGLRQSRRRVIRRP